MVDNEAAQEESIGWETKDLFVAPTAPIHPNADNTTKTKIKIKYEIQEYQDYKNGRVQSFVVLETVFPIMKGKKIPLGNYPPKFTVKKAIEFLNQHIYIYIWTKDRHDGHGISN